MNLESIQAYAHRYNECPVCNGSDCEDNDIPHFLTEEAALMTLDPDNFNWGLYRIAGKLYELVGGIGHPRFEEWEE